MLQRMSAVYFSDAKGISSVHSSLSCAWGEYWLYSPCWLCVVNLTAYIFGQPLCRGRHLWLVCCMTFAAYDEYFFMIDHIVLIKNAHDYTEVQGTNVLPRMLNTSLSFISFPLLGAYLSFDSMRTSFGLMVVSSFKLQIMCLNGIW